MAHIRGEHEEEDDLSERLGHVLHAAVTEGTLEYWEAYEVMMTVCGSTAADDFGPEPVTEPSGPSFPRAV